MTSIIIIIVIIKLSQTGGDGVGWEGANFPSTGCSQLKCGLYLDEPNTKMANDHIWKYMLKYVVSNSKNVQMSKCITCDMAGTIRTAVVEGLLAVVTQTHRRNKMWFLIIELAPTDKTKSVTLFPSHSLMDVKHLYSTSASNKRLTKQNPFFSPPSKVFPPVLGITLPATQHTSFPGHRSSMLPWRLPARSEHSPYDDWNRYITQDVISYCNDCTGKPLLTATTNILHRF